MDKELKDRAKLQSGVRKRWNGKVRGERAEEQGEGIKPSSFRWLPCVAESSRAEPG